MLHGLKQWSSNQLRKGVQDASTLHIVWLDVVGAGLILHNLSCISNLIEDSFGFNLVGFTDLSAVKPAPLWISADIGSQSPCLVDIECVDILDLLLGVFCFILSFIILLWLFWCNIILHICLLLQLLMELEILLLDDTAFFCVYGDGVVCILHLEGLHEGQLIAAFASGSGICEQFVCCRELLSCDLLGYVLSGQIHCCIVEW